ncbi:uncharacterized protein Tco025E_02120 [Trypanosoma conorhini]|uniref:Uncharacterized protein n=1 Tax=Trypanosoma conorhini TaxID=83891 RepID=A0A422Q6Q1_9TRYP|nr:uncharacterized protein Tco025E_02120 [Trypanosoma conorhini]RNF25624.1 hypothetical protein Tco025E_02120 [Trypanosoma conorhini]
MGKKSDGWNVHDRETLQTTVRAGRIGREKVCAWGWGEAGSQHGPLASVQLTTARGTKRVFESGIVEDDNAGDEDASHRMGRGTTSVMVASRGNAESRLACASAPSYAGNSLCISTRRVASVGGLAIQGAARTKCLFATLCTLWGVAGFCLLWPFGFPSLAVLAVSAALCFFSFLLAIWVAAVNLCRKAG